MRSVAPMLAFLFACSANPRLSVPPEVSDGDVVVFFVAPEDEEPLLYAANVAGEDLVVPIDLEPGQRVETELAIYDDRSLDDLQLTAGLVPFSTEGTPLPEPSAHYALTADGPPAEAPFEPLAWSNSRMSEARFLRSFAACLEGGRCVTAEGLCVACTGPETIDAPHPPQPIELTCPDGWAVHTINSEEPAIQMCDPRTQASRFDCPPGEVRKLGGDTCTRVGRACPSAGRFAEGVTGVFVDPDAPAGGDGTRAAPWRTVDEALADGSASILLSVGRHTLPTRTSLADVGTAGSPITFRGACASETTIVGGFDAMRAHLRFEDLAVEVDGAFYVGAEGSVALEGVAMEASNSMIPIFQSDGAVTVRDVVVDADGGFVNATGSSVTVEDAVVRAIGGRVIDTTGGASTTVRDVALVSGQRTSPMVWTDDVDQVVVQRLAAEEAVWTAVHIDGGTSAVVEDVFFVTETGTRFPSTYAVAAHRTRARLQRIWVQGALGLLHFTAELDIRDVVVHPDSPGTSMTERPAAIALSTRCSGTMQRAVVYEARHRGIRVDGSSVTLSDIRVQDVRPEEGLDAEHYTEGVVGLYITGDADPELERVVIRDVQGVALAQYTLLASIGRTLRIFDLDVRGSGPTACYAPFGGFLIGPIEYEMVRARFTDIRGAAIGIDPTANVVAPASFSLRAEHLAVARTTAIPGCNAPSPAIFIAEGAQLDLRGFDIGGASAPGILVQPSSVSAVDLTLLDATSGYIHDVPVGVRYEVDDPRLEALVDVRIEPNPDGVAIDHVPP